MFWMYVSMGCVDGRVGGVGGGGDILSVFGHVRTCLGASHGDFTSV
jgi:hypothetical protein